MQDGDEDYRVPEVINNLGLIYTRQGKDALAMEYYYQALESAKKSNNRRAQALALFNIGNHILSDKKYDDAEKILKQSLALTMATDEMKIRGSNYMALGQLKNETGKFDEAHVYILNFYELKDSLENIERVKKMDELEIRYETEKKEHTIELLEKDKKIQMLWANTLTIFLVMGAMLSIVIFYFQKNRERKNQMVFNLKIDQLTTQNNELSEKYKDVLASGNVKTIVSVDQRLLKKAIDVVEHNLGNPLFGVEQMANELAMSRTNLHRRIKAITGFSPSDLIRNIRLRKAATLLLNKADSIAQISFDVGFEDHSYFSKSFKKQFGVSPSEYLQSKEQPN
jgi:AraC-like DNA-binding protein